MNRIRDLFTPYQPSIAYGNEPNVLYEEKEPHTALEEYIHCYWRLRSTSKLTSDFMYRVVSDGCIDILYEQSHPTDIYITGFSTKYVEYNLGSSFDYVGVRFLPAGFPALFDVPANAVTDEFVPLKEVSPMLHTSITESINDQFSLDQATLNFDSIFSKQLSNKGNIEIDTRFLNAMNQILESRGQISLSDLEVGVSERQLRRLFSHYFGEAPKTFSKIIRFQNILGAKPSTESLRSNKIFYDEGYYDQAHFIKEFKTFYGVTPNQAFGR